MEDERERDPRRRAVYLREAHSFDVCTGVRTTLRWRELDSNLYGAFPVKWCFSVYCQFFVRSGKGPFFIPSPTIRFPERAEWGQGTETLAKLGGLPPSGACVWQRLDA
jgi:hypothetical protein